MPSNNNLVISYDLFKKGQNYDALIVEIKKLGSWAHMNLSVWYVDSPLTGNEAAVKLRAVMDANDKLLVVDATNNQISWKSLDPRVAEHLNTHWPKNQK
jgi:hypothetical protein